MVQALQSGDCALSFGDARSLPHRPILPDDAMKHAGAETLQSLAPLLARLRSLPGLVERTPGCFYRGSTAFLHFHADSTGTHADVRLQPPDFTRVRVATPSEQDAFFAAVRDAVM
jgi:hypothetical protein